MKYSVLKKLTTPELEVLKLAANDELFGLQRNQVKPQIDYWSGVSAMCKSILKKRNNG